MEGKYSSSPRQRRDRRREAPASGISLLAKCPIIPLLILSGLVFFLIVAIKGCKDDETTPKPTDRPTQVQTEPQVLPSETTAAPAETTPPAQVETTQETIPVTTTSEPVTTEPPGPRMMTVDDRYFYDALFLGDSRTDGLFLYSTPGDCKHYPYPATSMTIFKIMDAEDDDQRYGFKTTRDLLQGMHFGKIYLMFGINECGYDTGYFAEEYESVINEIRSYQPDALIYIQSICYVTQTHEENYPVFATENLKEKNEAIKKLANDVDIFYLEVNDALNDGTDHLPSEYTGDGAHLLPDYYDLWHEYLLEHAYVDAKHPWAPADENTTEPEGAQLENP